MKEEKLNKFSVSLGLLDYINPIFYTITMVTVIKNIQMDSPYNTILLIGAILSIAVGFIIPTGKVIVGLGIIQFVMPVSLVFSVNTGILLSGSMLLKYSLNLNIFILLAILLVIVILLFKMYQKRKKFNTIAVLIGACGYLMIYFSLILLSIQKGLVLPVIFYIIAIGLFFMLCAIGIKANLMKAKVHWIIETSNVTCQGLVALATLILFH